MIYKKSSFLMGTHIEIIIESEKNTEQEIFEGFWIFYSYEREFSRFLPDSSLSLLNQSKTSEVSNRFLAILELSKEIYEKTEHFFNPLINLSNIWYSQSFEKNDFSKVLSGNNLDLDTIKIRGNIVLLQEDQNLDFWGIVKWYCVDRVRDYLFSKWLKNFIINAGGDIFISWNNKWEKWTVGIDNPFINNSLLGVVELENKSISTSGSYKRKWKIENYSYHHIINPLNNNWCENEIISLSLIAPHTYITDTYATACFNMGIEKSLDFLKKDNIDSIIVWSDGQVYTSSGIEKYNFTTL